MTDLELKKCSTKISHNISKLLSYVESHPNTSAEHLCNTLHINKRIVEKTC